MTDPAKEFFSAMPKRSRGYRRWLVFVVFVLLLAGYLMIAAALWSVK